MFQYKYISNYPSYNSTIVTISFIAFVLAPVLSVEETGTIGMLYLLILIIPAILRWFGIANKYLSFCQKGYILFFVSALLSTIVGSYGILDQRVFKFFLLVLYGISITSFSYTQKYFSWFFKSYIFVAFGVAILICLSYKFGYAHVDSEYYLGRYSVGITGIYKNPNYLTSFMNLGLFMLIYYVLYSNKKTIRWYIAVIVCVTIICADYLSGTRAALLTAIFIIIAMFFFFPFKSRTKITGLLLISAIIVLVFLYQETLLNLLDFFMGRREATEDTARQLSWALALNKIIESPIWGCGLFSWSNIGGHFYLDYLHNIYLEIILNQGILGFLIFISMSLGGIKSIKKEDRLFVYMFLCVSGFPMLFQNGVVEINLWKFVLMNRIIIDYSRYSNRSLHSLFL